MGSSKSSSSRRDRSPARSPRSVTFRSEPGRTTRDRARAGRVCGPDPAPRNALQRNEVMMSSEPRNKINKKEKKEENLEKKKKKKKKKKKDNNKTEKENKENKENTENKENKENKKDKKDKKPAEKKASMNGRVVAGWEARRRAGTIMDEPVSDPPEGGDGCVVCPGLAGSMPYMEVESKGDGAAGHARQNAVRQKARLGVRR